MSRTEEVIQSRVDITIMRCATLRTDPASYSEVCDTFRPRLARARRTDSGRERFIHFLVPSSVRSRFVAEHTSEGRPASIQNRLRQAGLGESGGVHIADRDVVELSNDAGRELVVKVTAGVGDTRINVRRLTPFAGALHGSEFVSQFPQKPRILDLLPVGQGREVFEAQVNANPAANRPRLGLGDLHYDVQEPMTTRIAGEVRSVLDLAVRQRPRVEHPKGVSGKAKCLSLAPEIPAFQWHPAQGTPAAPAQERPVPLTAGLGVLFAYGIDGARVQGEFLAASCGQPIKIKATQQTGQRLDSVSIDQQHRGKLMRFRAQHKTLKLAETRTFTPKSPESPHLQERHFLPGASAAVSVPEK